MRDEVSLSAAASEAPRSAQSDAAKNVGFGANSIMGCVRAGGRSPPFFLFSFFFFFLPTTPRDQNPETFPWETK
jgi:hypothetical protein